MEWLKQQSFISPSSGGWKSKVKVLAWSDSGESPLTGLLSSCCVRMWLRKQAERGNKEMMAVGKEI